MEVTKRFTIAHVGHIPDYDTLEEAKEAIDRLSAGTVVTVTDTEAKSGEPQQYSSISGKPGFVPKVD